MAFELSGSVIIDQHRQLLSVGVITATSLDVSGDVDIDGTLEADAITINGSTLASVIEGTTVDDATNASVALLASAATNAVITDDTTGSGTHYLHFGSATSGNDGIEVDSTGLVYKDGKVGIGTASPDFQLHSFENNGSSISGLFETNQTDSYISFQASGTTASSTVRIGASGDDLTTYVNGAERLRILSGGGIGIGKSIYHLGDTDSWFGFADNNIFQLQTGGTTKIYVDNAGTTWNVNAAAGLSTTTKLINSATNASGNGVSLAFAPTQNYDVRFSSIDVVQDGNNNMHMAFKVTDATQDPHAIERMRITRDGKLLVGATAATNGSIAEFSKSVGSGALGCKITVENTSTDSVNNIAELSLKTAHGVARFYKYNVGSTVIQSHANGASDLSLYADGASKMRLYTNALERLRITSGGALQFSDVNSPNDQNTDVWVADDVLNFNAFGTNGAFIFKSGSSSTERLRINSTGISTFYGDITLEAAGANRISMRHTSGGAVVIKNPTPANLSFGTNNQDNELTIKNGGNIGIGTDNPQRKLVVSDDGTEGFEFFPGDSVNGGTLNLYNRATSGWIPLTINSSDFRWAPSGGTEAFRIASDGDVGIGTDLSGASGKFQVFGTNTVLARFGNSISATYEAISIKNTVAGYPAVCNDSSSDALDLRSMGSVQVTVDSNNNSTGKYFRVVHNGEGNSATELFRVGDDGKVGIGTDTPIRNLHVHEPSTGNAYLHLTNASTGGTTEDGFSLYVQSDGTTWYRARESTGRHIWTTAGDEKLRLTAAGSFRIGSSTYNANDLSNGAEDLRIVGDGNRGISVMSGISSVARIKFGAITGNSAVFTNMGSIEYHHDVDAMTFGVNSSGTERLRIDSSGKIGVGIVPSAWQSSTTSKVIQIGNSSVWDYNLQQFDLGQNFYYDGTDYHYIADGYATKLAQLKSDGSFRFYNAASGTAGNNVTWLERLRITSGQTRIGPQAATDKTSHEIQLSGAANQDSILSLYNPTNTDGESIRQGFFFNNSSGTVTEFARIESTAVETQAGSTKAGDIRFYTTDGDDTPNIGEKFRIASAGQIGLSGANYGTSGQVITSNGSGSAPTWQAAAGGGAGTGEQFVYLKNSSGNLNDGGENVYAGYRAGASLASGANENTFFGTDAGRYTATGDYNTYMGHRAAENATVGSNVAVGAEALRNNSSGSGNNVAVGKGAAENLGTASNSVAIGIQALRGAGAGAGNTVTGVSNIAIGAYAGDAMKDGSQNVLIGENCGGAMVSAHWNVCLGKDCANTATGLGNVILGHDSGQATSGNFNVVLGYQAGDIGSFSGANNIIIGKGSDPTTAATSNEITLGNTDINKFRIPGVDVLINSTGVGIGTTNPDAKLDVEGSEGQLLSVTNNLTSGSIFSVNDISGLPAIDFNATHSNLSLAPYGNNVSIGYTNAGTKLGLKGSTSERVYIVADELSDQLLDTINIDNGNVQYFTTTENGGTLTPNITSNNGLNNDLAIGDSTTVVVIVKPDSSSDKITNITIDGSAATEEWLGGSAPDGGANGSYDVYTFFILKTANATFLPLCNKVNFA